MRDKIPVGSTIASAYRFAFANLLNNLGAIWIPAVILLALSFFVLAPYQAMFARIATGDPQPLRGSAVVLIAYGLAMFVLIAAQWTLLTKEALGIRKGNVFLQNPFGPATWRLLATYLLFLLAMAAVYIAILIIFLVGGIVFAVLFSAMHSQAAAAILGIVAVGGIVAIVCCLFYAAVRLSFFMAPIAVGEEKIDLIRSWNLTRGNFWRIFAVLLAVGIPLLGVEMIYVFSAFGGELLPPGGVLASPEALAQWQQHRRQAMLHSLEWYQTYGYILYPVGFLIGAIIYALFAGASAFAYRSLISDEAARDLLPESA